MNRVGRWLALLLVVGELLLALKGAGIRDLVGRFVKRVNGQGAVATLSVGLVLNVYYVMTSTVPDLRFLLPDIMANLHFYELYPFMVIFLTLILVVVSLLTPAPEPEKLVCLEKHPKEIDTGGPLPWYRRFHFWWAVYLVAFVALYLAF